MSTITKLLDDLVAKRATLEQTANAFRHFNWTSPNVANADAEEDRAPAENSFDEVQTYSALTARQYEVLAAAYSDALEGGTLTASTWYLTFDRERDVNAPGGGHNLKNYWTRGAGAVKIRWGTDGSFSRCVAQLGKHVKNPQGLCAEYHKAATGEWPAEKGVESSMDGMVEAHGNHNQQDHDPTKGGDLDKLKSLVGMKPGDVKVPKSKGGLTSEKIRGTKANEPLDDRPGPYEDDDEDTTGLIGGDLESTRTQNIRRMGELERKADSTNGVSEAEIRELRKLRKLYGDLYDPSIDDERDHDDDDDENDFAVAAAVKKRRRNTRTYSDEPWSGVLAVEGVESGDGRLFGLGSLDWAQLPLPLMYQPSNIEGHKASIMVGEITNIARSANEIKGWGTVFGQALNGEHGEGIKNMMRAGGVSVDVDKVKDADVEMIYADGETNANPFAKPETTIFHRGRIRGATQVAFPAFVEAKLSFDNEGVLAADASCGCSDDPLVAAAHTIEIPDLPPAWWFDEPTDVKLSGALTITDEGRVYGILAPGKTHHRAMPSKTVPLGNVDYTRFHKGETIVAGGNRVVTGVITADCGHAPTQNYGTLQNRIDHYDNSCSVLANVRLGESRKGYVWVAGALNAGAKPHQVAQALGCALSGDWQPHPDRPGLRDFVSAHLVPVPGFPMARTQASVQYEDGVLSASSVPVRYVDESETLTVEVTFDTVMNWKSALALAIGEDPASRKAQLAREMRAM